MVKWIYLQNCWAQSIMVSGTNSSQRLVFKGVSRGQSWGQILLDIFTNDLDDGIMFWYTLSKLADKSKNKRK